MIISKSLLKHGYSVFNSLIIEYCNVESVIKREQYWFYLLEPPYNILKEAYSSIGYKHTP